MRRAEGAVEEEGPVGSDGLQVADPSRRLADDVLRHVVAVLRTPGRVDVAVVAGELGMELIGLSLQEPVEAVEALLQGPVRVRPRRRAFIHRRQVPLPRRVGGIAVGAQELGHGRGARADAASHVRETRVPVGHAAHADGMRVAAGEQRGPRRRAERGGVEPRVPQAVGGEAVDRGRGQLGAVAPEVGEAGVVEHDHHHVPPAQPGWCLRPPRRRVVVRAADVPAEVGFVG